MNLMQHADKPELTVTIGGQPYDFGEIPIEALAELQEWIRKNIPHPLEAIKPHLKGLPTDVAIGLTDRAREEAKDWPPEIGTAAGSAALLSKESGQILALRVGLQKFHPEVDARGSPIVPAAQQGRCKGSQGGWRQARAGRARSSPESSPCCSGWATRWTVRSPKRIEGVRPGAKARTDTLGHHLPPVRARTENEEMGSRQVHAQPNPERAERTQEA